MDTQFIQKAGAGLLQRTLQNRHTTGAALFYGACELADDISTIWLSPDTQVKMDKTISAIQKAAVVYGLIMAGDAGAQTQHDVPPSADSQKQNN